MGFDSERCAIAWANHEAVRLWGARDLPPLRARNCSGISAAARRRLGGYPERFRHGKQVEEQWTFYPNGKPTTVRCRCSGLWLAEGKGARLVCRSRARCSRPWRPTRRSSRSTGQSSCRTRRRSTPTGCPAGPAPSPAAWPTRPRASACSAPSWAASASAREVQVVTRQGQRWHALDARLSTDPASGAPVVLTRETDISDRVYAKELLRAQGEELLAALLAKAEERRDKGLLLANIREGLVMLDRSGRRAAERSAALSGWFGPHQEGATFWDCLAPFDPRVGARFRLGREAIEEDVLPLEVTLAQMPERIHVGGRTLQIPAHLGPRRPYRRRHAGAAGAHDA